MKRMACVIALAAGTGIAAGSATQPVLAESAPAAAASDLQIALATPGAVSSGSAVTLDVNFRGGNVRSIELYIDGTLIKKQAIRTRDGHGVISFALDGALLPEGSHELLVKAFDADGNSATATSNVRITPGDVNALVRFLSPKKLAMVQGVVPIQLKLDSTIHNPYVTFLIDNDFLAFTNYAPYTYNWDSTRVSNGQHSIGVEVYDGETLAKVQALTLNVDVNNPGGFTHRQKDTPDLSKKQTPGVGVAKTIGRIAAESAVPEAARSPQGVGSSLSRSVLEAAREMGLRAVEPGGYPINGASRRSVQSTAPADVEKTQSVRRSAFASPDSHPLLPTHRAAPSLPLGNPALAGLLASPDALSPILSAQHEGLARQTALPRHSGNIAALPGADLGAPAALAPDAHSKPVTRVAPTTGKALVGGGALTSGKALQVAFDSTHIAFDVQPRVEKGLPLAPFRQIFEHTGGQVKWYSKSRTVRAVNSTREIEFRVGDSEAKVNNQSMTLEAKPYLERGRAIVPLSFVRDSLDVKVTYDARTGRLLIESKK